MLLIDKTKLIEEARSWLGTPWVHNARVKGAGVDCINFVVACAESVQLKITIPAFYEQDAKTDLLTTAVAKTARLVSQDQKVVFEVADILLLSYKGIAHHLAIATGKTTIIHASRQAKKVIEQEISDTQRARLLGIYQLH